MSTPIAAARRRGRSPLRTALAVSATAALLGGTVLTGAGIASAAPKTPAPRPPAHLSTVGGDRLGVPGTQVDTTAGVPALPAKLTARSWIVADAETGAVLAEHNAHWKLPPASTLKMLFADVVLPKFPRTTKHTVQPSDLKGMGEGSSLVGVVEKQPYTVQDLWRGVFLRSGNDAVHVLAAMNGGVPATVAEMNAQAKELQANDTHVVTPDGYDEPGQASSAYDLTLFARAGLQNADFRAYCSTVTAQFPGNWVAKKDPKTGKVAWKRSSFQIQNTDRLLSGDYDLSRYPGIAGVKNGDTTNAGATYTGVAERNGRKLLVTVMNPAPKHNLVYREAASLLDWGFKAAPTAKPVGTLVPPLSEVKPTPTKAQAPQDGKRGDPSADTASSSSSSDGGVLTAVGIAVGTALVLAVLIIVVRRRRPLPNSVGAGPGPGPAGSSDGPDGRSRSQRRGRRRSGSGSRRAGR
ncbi:D-alanyl-D-alanine carboxypeptidase family protein [Streptomyces sp. CA-111067]|uniref:D-alanyl-D-alanine carboxypeptidase family protein n=1 Tax=Streptomyces sp. CA-111067 TaxID=3240046 RepID=UPI003D98D85E